MSHNRELHVRLIASGPLYQAMAATSAATFAVNGVGAKSLIVFLPQHERCSDYLFEMSKRFHFDISYFPFTAVSKAKLTAQLKCQAYENIVLKSNKNELLLFVDADTICFKPLDLSDPVVTDVSNGHLGFVKDIVDRHTEDYTLPWYLPRDIRRPYVNSGVMLVARRSYEFFQECKALATQDRFLTGPFNDQKIINYMLGHSMQKVTLLDERFNRFWPALLDGRTIIGHFACGAEDFLHSRVAMQKKLAFQVLHTTESALQALLGLHKSESAIGAWPHEEAAMGPKLTSYPNDAKRSD